jgi:hypothetical protein
LYLSHFVLKRTQGNMPNESANSSAWQQSSSSNSNNNTLDTPPDSAALPVR